MEGKPAAFLGIRMAPDHESALVCAWEELIDVSANMFEDHDKNDRLVFLICDRTTPLTHRWRYVKMLERLAVNMIADPDYHTLCSDMGVDPCLAYALKDAIRDYRVAEFPRGKP